MPDGLLLLGLFLHSLKREEKLSVIIDYSACIMWHQSITEHVVLAPQHHTSFWWDIKASLRMLMWHHSIIHHSGETSKHHSECWYGTTASYIIPMRHQHIPQNPDVALTHYSACWYGTASLNFTWTYIYRVKSLWQFEQLLLFCWLTAWKQTYHTHKWNSTLVNTTVKFVLTIFDHQTHRLYTWNEYN